MIIQSTRFGKLEIDESEIINFPHGIPGFPEEKKFILVANAPDSPFSFLQSTVEANLTFLLADPFVFFKEYEFKIDDEVTHELGLFSENPPQVFVIATVKEKLEDMTANLLAPVVINSQERIGRQIILEKTNYGTRHSLFPDGILQQDAQGGK
ncbi:flagellar assembly protein FliW [Pelosinus sp. sgz500959]|uniref:flagellar assembly protein FliW n=1 Tax=Pelosinus sp. sgz500959 TaxID=3242472 RepID=UPI003671B4B2